MGRSFVLSLSLSFTLSKMLYLFLSLSLVCTQKHSIMFSHKHTTFLTQKFSLYFSQHVTHNLSLPLSLTASLINHCTIVYLFSVYLSRCPTCYLPSYLPTLYLSHAHTLSLSHGSLDWQPDEWRLSRCMRWLQNSFPFLAAPYAYCSRLLCQ